MSYFDRHIAPRVGEPDLAGALVGQLDEPLVVLPQRRADRVPAAPHLKQLGGIAALRHHLGHLR